MSIKYKTKPKPEYHFDKLEKTNMYFDFYYPPNFQEYSDNIYSYRDFYIIRDQELLEKQLKEMYSSPKPDFYWNNEYISQGIINFNNLQMYNYINNKFPGSIPIGPESDRYLFACTDYISDIMYMNLMDATDWSGGIIAYRFRYIFPPHPLVFVTSFTIRALKWILFKDNMRFITAYSFVPGTNTTSAAMDIIISNGPSRPFINLGKRHTLYSDIEYMPRVLNSDIEFVLQGIDPKTGRKLVIK